MSFCFMIFVFFFFNDTATTEIYTLSLHDALPNSISALTSIDPARAREMCLLLADFLRLTLGMGEKNVILLSEELDLLEKFMAIEKVRFGERLHMEENIQEEARRCVIPALIMQPLLENAVSHGIAS